jgi:transposase InsO family protein
MSGAARPRETLPDGLPVLQACCADRTLLARSAGDVVGCGGMHWHFATRAQARTRVAAWIGDYNRQRRHFALGMSSLVDYEQALAAGEAA